MRKLIDKILRVGIKLCMLTGVAFTFAACYGSPDIPEMELEVSGVVTNEENEPIENIEVSVEGWMINYTNADGKYVISDDSSPIYGCIDIIARDTTDVYESDTVTLKVVVDPTTKKHSWTDGSFIAHQDFQLKKK